MKYNLLIVDDEIYSIEDICSCIDADALQIGQIHTAVNITKARQILDTEDIHIILSDIDMPGGSGLTFLRSVRDTHADTPCIFITNYADFSYAQEAIHLKVMDYILKPVEPGILFTALQKAEALVDENLPEQQDAEPAQNAEVHSDEKTVRSIEKPAFPCQKEKYVSCAIAYIEDNLLANVTRESVSEHVHVTPDHLDRLFREQLGMSAFRYIVAQKVALAKRLLAETDQPIGTIAADLGYCNLSNFSLTFRKVTKMTPAEYRKLQTGQGGSES